MYDQVTLWERRGADGLERRCAVALIGEGEFELRVWRGTDLILEEQFPTEAALLNRAATLARGREEAGQ
jgi:hypothetical protein